MSSDEERKQQDSRDYVQKLFDAQMDLLKRSASTQADAFRNFITSMQAFTNLGAVFKTTVQKAGRISIPEAERQALGIKEGDLVQVFVMPLERKTK
jgi:AbrB family looped-hinge helix DNA binding protein